uniref:hypothetical protein n=1 Tax=Gluconobacter sp. P5H9_a TaxID=2762616 RepID=UPI001C05915A
PLELPGIAGLATSTHACGSLTITDADALTGGLRRSRAALAPGLFGSVLCSSACSADKEYFSHENTSDVALERCKSRPMFVTSNITIFG